MPCAALICQRTGKPIPYTNIVFALSVTRNRGDKNRQKENINLQFRLKFRHMHIH